MAYPKEKIMAGSEYSQHVCGRGGKPFSVDEEAHTGGFKFPHLGVRYVTKPPFKIARRPALFTAY